MNRQQGTLICLTFIAALLSNRWLGFDRVHPSPGQWGLAIAFWLFGGVSYWAILRWRGIYGGWRQGLLVSIVGILAVSYFQLRLPTPQNDDVSQLLSDTVPSLRAIVRGKILNDPQPTGDGSRQRFWLAAQKVEFTRSKKQTTVSGKLYVTLPRLEGRPLYASQRVALKGRLYRPRSPQTPGAFDFKAYLVQKGAFAGMKGETLMFASPAPTWRWGKFRQRIVGAQARWLPQPEASILSSMVLGQRAVNLSSPWRDRFAQVGLAHVIAASGFHVALLLGVVLRLTPNLSPVPQSLAGIACLGCYVGLTGLQPSILRAALMGASVLLARIGDRKIRPLGSLLLTATLLLAINPLWIWDLGFQLSFLATLGLMASANPIQKHLDWLPPAISSALALPLAANLWVLPLILQVFRVLPTYSIVVNVLAAPLILIISLGGMISGFAGLLLPVVGSAIAWGLWIPLWLLSAIVQFFENLPLSAYAVGHISPWVTVSVYGILVAIAVGWLKPRWRWLLLCAIPMVLLIPPAYSRLTLQQVTLLPVTGEPVLLLQDRGKATLIGGSDPNRLKYTIHPYLTHQGIDRLQCWLALVPQPSQSSSCQDLSRSLPVKQLGDRASLLQPAIAETSMAVGNFNLQWRSLQPAILQIQYRQEAPWWVIPDGNYPSALPASPPKLAAVIGKQTTANEKAGSDLPVKIAVHSDPPRQFPLEWSADRDGTVLWTPARGWHLLQEDNFDPDLDN